MVCLRLKAADEHYDVVEDKEGFEVFCQSVFFLSIMIQSKIFCILVQFPANTNTKLSSM